MYKVLLLVLAMSASAFTGVTLGPEISISDENLVKGFHQEARACVLPNGTYSIVFVLRTSGGGDQLCSALLQPESTSVIADLIKDYYGQDVQLSQTRLNTTSDKYLISYAEDGVFRPLQIAHQWVSFENEIIGEHFYNYFANTTGSHRNTIVLPDENILTLWRNASSDGWDATNYYEILKPNGQSIKLTTIAPCSRYLYSAQCCLLSPGNVVLNWFNFVASEWGYIRVPYIEYFQILNKNGSVIQSDSTNNFQYIYNGLIGLQNGGFATCYWRDDTHKAYVQAFSEQLQPQSEPQEILSVTKPSDILNFNIVELSNGNVVVLWNSLNKKEHWVDIISLTHGSIFSALEPRSPEIPKNSTMNCLPLPNGRFIVGWDATRPGEEKIWLFAKVYNADGSLHTDEFIINDETPFFYNSGVRFAGSGNTVLACWCSEIENKYVAVQARFLFVDDTHVKEEKTPNSFSVHQNYPNPFNAQTTIQFDIPSPGSVDVHIYSVSGRIVYRENSYYSVTGHHQVNWNGRDTSQRSLPSGIYMVKLLFTDQANNHYSSVQKVVLSR